MTIEATVVDNPQFFPQMCVCGSQKRPIADTGIELLNQARLYICVDCAKILALAYGFAKGPEMDKLMQAGKEIAQMRTEVSAHAIKQVELEDEVRRLSTEKALVEEERDIAQGKADQLQHIAAALERTAHEMTSGAPA